jgi:hypothetical protein
VCAKRWHAAVAELVDLQAGYAHGSEAAPAVNRAQRADNLLDEPPRGYGRD